MPTATWEAHILKSAALFFSIDLSMTTITHQFDLLEAFRYSRKRNFSTKSEWQNPKQTMKPKAFISAMIEKNHRAHA